MKKIILIVASLFGVLFADFSRSSTGVVSDGLSMLQWQDDYSDNNGSVKSATWIDAINYCENLQLDGGGWRLPNIRELNSIVDFQQYEPAINPVFVKTEMGYYWSSTTYNADLSYAWYIDFTDGSHNYNIYTGSPKPDGLYYIRCVRDYVLIPN